jgi:two-component system cell cycle sensor histidine kinase/response regulator CckA
MPYETVLVVEDEHSLRRLAQRVLERAGYRVLAASNGAEAREQFAQHRGRIDLLLTDVVMPGVSGPDLFRSLADQNPALSVVYMSGYPEEAIERQAGLDRSRPFVQKPFTASALVEAVREALGRR